MCVCACVRACVCACVRACVRACERACLRACVRVSVFFLTHDFEDGELKRGREQRPGRPPITRSTKDKSGKHNTTTKK